MHAHFVENSDVFVKRHRIEPSTAPADISTVKRHSLGVFPEIHLPPVEEPYSDERQSPQSDGGRKSRRSRRADRNRGGVINSAFSDQIPDIKIRDYNSDEDTSV